MQKIKTYDSGLRVVCEEMSGFTSVAFNIYVSTGSMKEDESNQGISHLIEHMMFKGTEKRSAFDIAEGFKNVGAQSNAFTSREETVYYSRSIRKYLEDCVEILSDMLFNSKFDEKELRKEKKVVIEELKMYNDDAGVVGSEIVDKNFYNGSPYTSNIIGTKKSVNAITREQILEYIKKNYTPENIIISFAGDIDFESAINLTEKYFQPLLIGNNIPVIHKFISDVYPDKPIYKTKFKDNQQSEVFITYRSFNRFSELSYATALFNIIWGSGSNMSSRLFQTIREKMGLVYRIDSGVTSCDYGGDMSITFSTSTKNVSTALRAVKAEINKLLSDGVTEKELESAKVYLSTAYLFRFENTSRIANSNAKELAIYGRIEQKEDYIDKINSVTLEDIKKVIDYIYNNNNYVVCCVGKDKTIKLHNDF